MLLYAKNIILIPTLLGLLLFVTVKVAHADVPVREQNLPLPVTEQNLPLPTAEQQLQDGMWPVWVQRFDECTDYQETLEEYLFNLHSTLVSRQIDEELSHQIARIMKAREDVNKLIASVYDELKTQQIVTNSDIPDFKDALQSFGIVALDESTDEICKASYYVRAKIGKEPDQCVAVAQEARIITNQDDYIYEEGRRRATDMLFCYLGEWRHFPIGSIADPRNCEALGLQTSCNVQEVWEKLGELLGQGQDYFSDLNGEKTPDDMNDDQHVFQLCEGMRALGKKCAQDVMRDYLKYSTIDKITRKDRTIILAPPQTWYTPDRCRIITSFLPVADEVLESPGRETPYTKTIKSLDITDPSKFTSSFELIDYYFGSKFGNATLPKMPADMNPAEFDIQKELQAINVPENNLSGLAVKVEALADQIIREFTDLRKLQYSSGEGLRDATVRIGWQDYEWGASGPFLTKYKALDLPADDPKKPNKVFKPLPCYWESTASTCWGGAVISTALTGKTFYFDTGIVTSPIAILKDKLRSAIQAQFDLARDTFAFADPSNPLLSGRVENVSETIDGCASPVLDWVAPSIDQLPAPWEDTQVDLAQSTNPLTGQDYVAGGYLIPFLAGNYFNTLYNDVFQLYHTPFPDILEKWFRAKEPGYDSIYAKP